jgi:hypothetical protein
MFEFDLKEIYYAIKFGTFHYGLEDLKDRGDIGIYSTTYDGYHFIVNCYLFFFGWWPEYYCKCDRCNRKT